MSNVSQNTAKSGAGPRNKAPKKKVKKNVATGIAYVQSTFNNTVVTITDVNGNTVSSTQVADARIEYRGTGYIDEAQTMGWLSRFFLTALPF